MRLNCKHNEELAQHHFFSKSEAGFTLLEMMISIGILALIGSLGLIVSMDFYRGYSFNYEEELAVSVLQRARSQAMANIDRTQHGACLIGSNYVISNGNTCVTGATFPKAVAVTVTWPTAVIFNQLDGSCTVCSPTPLSVTLTGQGKTAVIIINSEGRIDY